MYGWFNQCLENLIIEKFGEETWSKICAEANHKQLTGIWKRNVMYPDDLIFNIFSTAALTLNLDEETLMEMFGQYFIYHVRKSGFESTMRCQGRNFEEWLKNINESHRLFKSRYPNSAFPDMWCEEDAEYTEKIEGENRTILCYQSQRGKFFSPMVVGIVKEAAKEYFGVEVSMNRLNEVPNKSTIKDIVVWRLSYKTILNASYDSLDSSEVNDSIGLPAPIILSTSTSNDRISLDPIDTSTPANTPMSSTSSNRSRQQLTPINIQSPLSKLLAACPFSNLSNARYNRTRSGTEASTSNESIETAQMNNGGIGLSPNAFKKVFPYHIVIDKSFKIIQLGEKILSYISQHTLYAPKIGSHIGEYFSLINPPKCPWDWNVINSNKDFGFELKITLEKLGQILSLRGSLLIVDPATDLSAKSFHCIFLVSPNFQSISEMKSLKMNFHEIPLHSSKRDLVVLGEHLLNETDSRLKLDAQSRVLDEESRITYNALKTKRIFVRYVSHEIRTPLNITLLGLNYLEKKVHEFNETKKDVFIEVLNDLKISCGIAVDILNDLLLYEKIDDGALTLSTDESLVSSFLESVIQVFQIQAKSQSVEFSSQFSALDGIFFSIDKNKFSQVIRNLVSNALKFCKAGGKVHVSCNFFPYKPLPKGSEGEVNGNQRRTSLLSRKIHSFLIIPNSNDQDENEELNCDYVRISVSDTGPGISKEEQKLLFKEFIQFKADKLQNGQGSGLGLWISRNIVKLHGGRIGVISEGDGNGSTFYVDIPAYKLDADTISKKHKSFDARTRRSLMKSLCLPNYSNQVGELSKAEDSESSTLDSKTFENILQSTNFGESDIFDEILLKDLKEAVVLLVDDSPTNRKMVSRIFSDKVKRIDEASDGLEAVQKVNSSYKSHVYDIIFMDYLMPEMNGTEATKIIRSQGFEGFIIGITGNGLKEDIEFFKQSGADEVIVKPLRIEDVLEILSIRYKL